MSMTEIVRAIGPQLVSQMGVGVVFAIMLALYYEGENDKWEKLHQSEQSRWELLFRQNKEDNAKALETIKSCCDSRQSVREP